jgi:hypothetical protein
MKKLKRAKGLKETSLMQPASYKRCNNVDKN